MCCRSSESLADEQYLQAYAAYQRWDRLTYEWFLKRVKDVALLPAPRESDEADRRAVQYFRLHADGGNVSLCTTASYTT